jgi:hypothetical protein
MKESKYTSTTLATATTVEVLDQNIKCGKLESFTFDKQKKFGFIEIIYKYVEEKIRPFSEIWPFLGAYTFNGAWDPDIDEDLEFIGIAHYTVLKSFSYVFQNKDSVSMNDPSQRFKNIIFHYALIIDCIKQISFHIIKFQNKLNPGTYNPIQKLSREDFLTMMGNWYDKFYENRFENFQNTGGIVMHEIHSSKSYLSLLSKGRNFKSYNRFNDIITPYRNVFIHNPSIDIFHKGRKPMVVRSNYIKNNRTIQNISKLEIENCINPQELMDQLFKQSTKMLSDVWIVFRNELEKINTDLNFPNQRLRKDNNK